MLQAQGDDLLLHRRWRGLRMALVDGRQVFQAFEATLLKALFVLVELGARHTPLPARFTDVAQRLGQLQDAQSLVSKLHFG